MARIQFGKGDLGPDGPRSPLPNWILAIFLVQFFNQTRVIPIHNSLGFALAAMSEGVERISPSALFFQLLHAIDWLYLKVTRSPYYRGEDGDTLAREVRNRKGDTLVR